MKQIVFYGRGGQGVVTAAKIMVAAACKQGKHAHCIPSFTAERRGAPVYSYARISDEPIDLRSFVYVPDCIMLFDVNLPGLGVDVRAGAHEDTLMVANTEMSAPEMGSVYPYRPLGTVDANRIAVEAIKVAIPNSAMLGAFCATTGWVSIEAMAEAIEETFSGKGGAINADIARRACRETQIQRR